MAAVAHDRFDSFFGSSRGSDRQPHLPASIASDAAAMALLDELRLEGDSYPEAERARALLSAGEFVCAGYHDDREYPHYHRLAQAAGVADPDAWLASHVSRALAAYIEDGATPTELTYFAPTLVRMFLPQALADTRDEKALVAVLPPAMQTRIANREESPCGTLTSTQWEPLVAAYLDSEEEALMAAIDIGRALLQTMPTRKTS